MKPVSFSKFSVIGIPTSALPRAYEALWFAQRRGYAVCYRTDTGKPHIAKPMGQRYEPKRMDAKP